MAETVTGYVKDFTDTVYASGRNPELWFIPSGSAVGDAIYAPSPVKATLNSGTGAFTVELVSIAETVNRIYYTPQLRVNNGPDHRVTVDFPDWRLFVTSGGGEFTALIEAPLPPGSFVFGYGPPPPELANVLYIDISGDKPVYYGPGGA